jgi:hypothetical protein
VPACSAVDADHACSLQPPHRPVDALVTRSGSELQFREPQGLVQVSGEQACHESGRLGPEQDGRRVRMIRAPALDLWEERGPEGGEDLWDHHQTVA